MSLDSTPYQVIMPEQLSVPMLISAPHCGVQVTEQFKANVADEHILTLPDTDWYVHQLYDFATELNIPMIHAVYSRYIVDLNRQLPGEQNLYANTSRVTGLVPLRTFTGDPIYKAGAEPTVAEIEQRIERYHRPYYAKVSEILETLQQKFPIVMLYDGHSIKGQVKTIQTDPFLDYMPANRSGLTCPNAFIDTATQIIQDHGASCIANGPFQGGNITRSFHNAEQNVLSFQMEISQRIYMNEQTDEKCEPNWSQTVKILREIIENFSAMLLTMNEVES